MKKTSILKSLILLAVIASMALPASIQAQGKIATVDMRKVFDNYYKTKQASALLQNEVADLEKQRKDMVEDWRKGDADYKALIDKANDQAISAEERAKNKLSADKKMAELKDAEQAINEFQRRSNSKLQDKKRIKWEDILKEIRAVVEMQSKAANFSLVIDSAAESANGTPIILFSNGENDITEAVLTQLNATAPLTPAADASKTNAVPAASPAPKGTNK